MPEDGHKRCARCGESKPASEFFINRRTRDGLQSWCKTCCLKNNNVSRGLKRWRARLEAMDKDLREKLINLAIKIHHGE